MFNKDYTRLIIVKSNTISNAVVILKFLKIIPSTRPKPEYTRIKTILEIIKFLIKIKHIIKSKYLKIVNIELNKK